MVGIQYAQTSSSCNQIIYGNNSACRILYHDYGSQTTGSGWGSSGIYSVLNSYGTGSDSGSTSASVNYISYQIGPQVSLFQNPILRPRPVEAPRPAPAPPAPSIINPDKVAEALLVRHLSPAQRTQFRETKSFDVMVGARRYRLRLGWAGNVSLLDGKGNTVEQFCIHPVGKFPHADNLLAQKLLLETDEAKFLQIANKTIIVPRHMRAA